MTNVVSISPLDWYLDILLKSGVTGSVAEFAGIKLENNGFKMPYHDIQGNYTGIASKRFNTKDKNLRYKRVEGIGLPVSMYWPLHPSHIKSHQAMLGESIGHELWVTEGERKSLCLQSQMLAQGITGSAVSMPGISVWRHLIAEIDKSGIQFAMATGKGIVRRRVVLCYDWNKENSQVRASEAQLFDYFHDRGAEVIVLRWKLKEEDAEKEQKIDDWLVAGGKLDDALADSPPYKGGSACLYKYNEMYGVLNGKVVILSNLAVMTSQQFRVQTQNEYDPPPGKGSRPQYHSDKWLAWPARRTISEMTFVPPPIGSPSEQRPPAYNVAPEWPILGANQDFTAFDEHLEGFCESKAHYDWLRCHFAHMMLFPNELTSNAICFADNGNTGKGLLLTLMSKVFGAFFNLTNAEEIAGRFNDNMIGKILVWYDEPAVDRFKNLEAACKRLVGNDKLKVEGKGGKGATVQNRIRLVISCNLAYSARLDKSDRRWNYFGRGKPLPADKIQQFLNFSNMDCGHDWLHWAKGVYGDGDWCGVDYSPNKLGPVSQRRTHAIASSGTIYEDILNDPDLEHKDIWEVSVINTIAEQNHLRVSKVKLGRELEQLGSISHDIKSCGRKIRVRSVRNHEYWEKASHSEILTELSKISP